MTFSVDLSRAVENIKADAEQVIRGTVFGISARIIKATPVGNPDIWQGKPPAGYVGGTLRNSWHSSIASPSTLGARRPLANGDESINDLTVTIDNWDMGSVFYMANNMPYAIAVEYGWSSQAPAGMVRRAIAATEQELRKNST